MYFKVVGEGKRKKRRSERLDVRYFFIGFFLRVFSPSGNLPIVQFLKSVAALGP